jgi:hypothetical protein
MFLFKVKQFQKCHTNFRKFHSLFSTGLSQARLSQVLLKMGSESTHFWHPVQCSSMSMNVSIQLLALEHCYSNSAGSCLTTLLTTLISLRATIICLPARNGWAHSAPTIMSRWKASKRDTSQAADIFDPDIPKVIHRYDACVSSGDDCSEK